MVSEGTGQNEKKIAHSFVPSEGFASSHSLFGGTAKIAKRLSHNQHLWRVRWNRHLKSDPGPIDDSGEGGRVEQEPTTRKRGYKEREGGADQVVVWD